MRINLRPNEKFYVNGAVIKVNRKVALEFLNDVTFLLENHVMQPEQATTPLRQLYFVVQTILIDPVQAETARRLFEQSCSEMSDVVSNPEILSSLKAAKEKLESGRTFDALKTIRALFPLEHETMAINRPLPINNFGIKSKEI